MNVIKSCSGQSARCMYQGPGYFQKCDKEIYNSRMGVFITFQIFFQLLALINRSINNCEQVLKNKSFVTKNLTWTLELNRCLLSGVTTTTEIPTTTSTTVAVTTLLDSGCDFPNGKLFPDNGLWNPVCNENYELDAEADPVKCKKGKLKPNVSCLLKVGK